MRIAFDFKLMQYGNGYNVEDSQVSSLSGTLEGKYTSNKTITIKTRPFSYYEIEYWRKYLNDFDEQMLHSYGIYALDAAWINGKSVYNYRKGDIVFAYHLKDGNHFQLNFVKSSFDTRFIVPNMQYVIGEESIDYNCNGVLITKGYKEWTCTHRFGINVCAILGESIYRFPNEELLSRFPFKFTLFDNDEQGRRCSIEYRKRYNTIPLLFPKNEPKDFSDNLEKYKYEYMNDYIEYTKRQCENLLHLPLKIIRTR